MPKDYNFFYFTRDYASNLTTDGFDININDLINIYKNTEKELKMRSIFNQLDSCDGYTDGKISFFRQNDMPKNLKEREFAEETIFRFFNKPNNLNSEDCFVEMDKVHEKMGADVTEDDFKEALGLVMQRYDEHQVQVENEEENEFLKFREKYKDYPEGPVRFLYMTDENGNIREYEENGEKKYEITSKNEENSVTCQYLLDEKGNYIATVADYHTQVRGEYLKKMIFSHEDNFKTEEGTDEQNPTIVTEYAPNGLQAIRDYENNSLKYSYENNSITYADGDIKSIVINENSSNKTELEVVYNDDYEIIDIKKSNNSNVTLTDETKKKLITSLNKNAKLGEEFTFGIKNNEINIEVVKDKNLPTNIKSFIDKLGEKGCLPNQDFNIKKEENGNYTIELLTAQARDYSCDKKSVTFLTDGTEKVNEYTKPYQKEGTDYWETYDVQNTDFAQRLLNISDRENISDTQYKQKIGNKEYNVKLCDNKITVKSNGKTFDISTENMHPNLAKMLFETNPAALYRMGEKGITIKFEKTKDGVGGGEYVPAEKLYI